MWRTLGNLAKKRTWFEAVLFYLVYVSAGIFLCGIITTLVMRVFNIPPEPEYSAVVLNFAPLLGGIYTLIVAFALILYKNIYNDAFAILCALIGGFASASLGMIFGFIPVALLSGFSPISENKS